MGRYRGVDVAHLPLLKRDIAVENRAFIQRIRTETLG